MFKKHLLIIAVLGSWICLLPWQSVEAKVVAKKKPVRHHYTVSAIPGADEKSFSNPTSRCLIPTIIKLNDQAVQQMKKDVEKVGQAHTEAVATYQNKLAIIWDAMKQPYCGFGSRGVRAVESSFRKSVNKTRAEFLVATKTVTLGMNTKTTK